MKFKQRQDQQYMNDLIKMDELDQEVKFDLFVQSRRVKQISIALDKIFFDYQNINTLWLKQNQEFISELLEELLEESLLVLDGVKIDGESLDLSMKLVSDIYRSLAVVQQMTEAETNFLN
ncbi:hypothetical protein KO465_04575 [Candidatus Micrarchaeota archaeon]|nr:hypothetical protein [Candidatus Micrarchaeota archaeon]